jgi:hypothetical protein
MKTAMTELIELIENGETNLDLIENHKQIWLEREKHQMLSSSISGSNGNSFEEYYNETYKK